MPTGKGVCTGNDCTGGGGNFEKETKWVRWWPDPAHHGDNSKHSLLLPILTEVNNGYQETRHWVGGPWDQSQDFEFDLVDLAGTKPNHRLLGAKNLRPL